MQAIETRILSVTNTRPTRIVATCSAGTITRPYPSEVFKHTDGSVDDREVAAHYHIAKELMDKYGWRELTWGNREIGTMRWGQLANGHYVFCFDQSMVRG